MQSWNRYGRTCWTAALYHHSLNQEINQACYSNHTLQPGGLLWQSRGPVSSAVSLLWLIEEHLDGEPKHHYISASFRHLPNYFHTGYSWTYSLSLVLWCNTWHHCLEDTPTYSITWYHSEAAPNSFWSLFACLFVSSSL